MIIEYNVSEYKTETKQIEIEDTKNVFLKGTNPYNGSRTYFGIWTNDNGLSIVTVVNGQNIYYEHSKSGRVYTQCDIKEYLKNNKNVSVITKAEFKEQIKYIRLLLDI